MAPFHDSFFGNPKYNEDDCFVSSAATVIGEVFIEKDVIIAPGARLRADEGTPFRIGKGTNIRDGVILHGLLDRFVEVNGIRSSISIGNHCSLAHGSMVHGPALIGKMTFIGFCVIIHGSEVGSHCFVDFRATIKNATVGKNCHIGICSIINGVDIPDGRYVDDGMIVTSQEVAEMLPQVPDRIRLKDEEFNKEVVDYNKGPVRLYKERRALRNKG